MSSDTFQTISAERRRAMLRTAMGPAIAAALGDPRIIEIMVNPDGALRVDVLGEGRVETDVTIPPVQVERIIRLVASHARAEVHGDAPIISAELPPHEEGAGAGSVLKACCRPWRRAPALPSANPRHGSTRCAIMSATG
jgi:type IV secretion system protein VirB11